MLVDFEFLELQTLPDLQTMMDYSSWTFVEAETVRNIKAVCTLKHILKHDALKSI